MRRTFVMLATVLVAAAALSGCDNGPSTAPTPPATNPITETFTGTVNLNGSVTHSFSATAAGTVTATITSLDPATGSVLGFQMGTWNTVTCSAVLSNDVATTGSAFTASTQSAASLCVKLHDPNGALTANPVSYTVTVVHN
ncbi:MAG TPA: hypothetical protein VH740_01270 [Vicinamibacterales bacterium]|jgi:hypothetical protein